MYMSHACHSKACRNNNYLLKLEVALVDAVEKFRRKKDASDKVGPSLDAPANEETLV